MTWEQKLAAIQALCGWDGGVRMRAPGNWYVSGGMNKGGNGMLRGEHGNGKTPEEAVEAHWDIYVTHIPSDRYIVVKGRRVRWNGYMWEDVSV